MNRFEQLGQNTLRSLAKSYRQHPQNDKIVVTEKAQEVVDFTHLHGLGLLEDEGVKVVIKTGTDRYPKLGGYDIELHCDNAIIAKQQVELYNAKPKKK